MTYTGSYINLLQGSSKPQEPEVGMGATMLYWTDRQACTITAVKGNVVTVVPDEVERTDNNGMSDAQNYSYKAGNPAHAFTFSKRKNGRYVKVGETLKGGTRLGIGYRDQYHDYSF